MFQDFSAARGFSSTVFNKPVRTLAIADVTGDGLVDVFAGFANAAPKMLVQNGGQCTSCAVCWWG